MSMTWYDASSVSRSRKRSTPRAERVHYQRDGVTVTDSYLESPLGKFAINDLDDLRMVRGRGDPLAVSSILVAGGLALAVVVGWAYLGQRTAWVGLASLMMIPIGLAVVAARTRVRHYQLWAACQGRDVMVVLVQDPAAYGQICRAVIRAKEAAWRSQRRQRRSAA